MFGIYSFFFNDTATTEIYTLSLHDALPISRVVEERRVVLVDDREVQVVARAALVVEGLRHEGREVPAAAGQLLDRRLEAVRSEEHTSELQSRQYLVCRLLLEKKITR